MSKAATKARKRRRRTGEAKHVRIYLYMLRSPAWRSLSCHARCLLIEFNARYNGANNGELVMSVRTAAALLRTGMRQARSALAELTDRGFIVATRKGRITGRAETRIATTWRLTEHEDDLTGREATKEFMRWLPDSQPAEMNSTVAPEDTHRGPRGHGHTPTDGSRITDRGPTGHAQADSAPTSVAPEDTHIGMPATGSPEAERSRPAPSHTPNSAHDGEPARHKHTPADFGDFAPPKRGGWFGARGSADHWPAHERRALGLTQEQLSQLSGVQRPYIAAVERGVRNPGPEIRDRIAAALAQVSS